jgi:hypothetical protein
LDALAASHSPASFSHATNMGCQGEERKEKDQEFRIARADQKKKKSTNTSAE